MTIEVQTALISAAVAVATASVGAFLSWSQLRRERNRWLVEFKSAYSIELYRTRLGSYATAFTIIGRLSHRNRPITSETVRGVADELNGWLYSSGGLCAGTRTRGAILGLRQTCDEWADREREPSNLYMWRNAALALLRLDLDLKGLESYDFKNPGSLLAELQRDIESLEKERQGGTTVETG